MPRNTSLDDVCALLASGKNVVTTAFLFYPRALPPADLERVLDACERGRSSIHGTGLNPGNLSGVLPLALSGHDPEDRTDHLARAGRLVVLREHEHHVRQHAVRAAARGGQRSIERLPPVQQRHLQGRGPADRRCARGWDRRGDDGGRPRARTSAITTSSARSSRRARSAASDGIGEASGRAAPSSRSTHSGLSVASTRTIGRRRLTVGRSRSRASRRCRPTCSAWPASLGTCRSPSTYVRRASRPPCRPSTRSLPSARRTLVSARWPTCR